MEKIKTEEIRARARVANITENIREARLRWLGRVEGKTEDVVIGTWKPEVSGHQNIRRPKLRWRNVIQKYLTERKVHRQKKNFFE